MLGEILRKLIAKPLAGSKAVANAAAAAVASVCESLLLACKSTLAQDFSRIKEAHLKRLEAQTRSQEAEAQKKLAEAASDANKITRRAHADELARLDRERLDLENKKTAAEVAQAEAKADKARLEVARLKMRVFREALNAGKKRSKDTFNAKEEQLFEALRQLQSEGGMLYVDAPELSPVTSKPASPGRIKTSHSEALNSYRFS
jgi:hypothetical protein